MARILLVEDEPLSRKVAFVVLTRLGYEVETACNGLEAVDAFRCSAFDAILMDCSMPEMDGLEATEHIREIEGSRGTRTPIIALTCMSNPSECLQAGMDAHILKTGNLDNLREEIQRWAPLTQPRAAG
ncbi:MAG: response regulator [Candidatus Eremiobacterota bacterium]